MLNTSCTIEQKVKITATPKTAAGNPATFDGAINVTVQSGDGTTQPVDGDPNSFYVISPDAPGDTVYLIQADADLGSGTEMIQDNVTLTAVAANAANFGLQAGSPEPK